MRISGGKGRGSGQSAKGVRGFPENVPGEDLKEW